MNNYENARKGVSKVFASQILDIVYTVCFFIGIIAIVVAIAGAAADSVGVLAGGGIAGVVFMIGALVVFVIGYILKIVGCAKAGKDNQSFHNAFIFSIISIILAVVYAVMFAVLTVMNQSNTIFDDIAKILLDLCKMFVLIYIIQGCAELAEEKGNEVVAGKAKNLLTVIIILLIIALACNFFATAFVGTFANVVTVLCFVIYLVGDVVAYILFIILLGKTKKMLAE